MPSSRVDKYVKRRKNTKRLSLLLILTGVLVIVFLGFLIFGGGSETNESNEHSAEKASEESPSQSDTDKNSHDKEHETEKDDTDKNSDSESTKEGEEQDQEEVEPSDDNVQKAYTADWEPVGTNQTGSHTINYDEGSQDRQEMRQAVAVATDLNESDFTMWWVERHGDQQVINTVSDPSEKNIYRVYNKWVANKGWRPTKVEKIKENDKKQR